MSIANPPGAPARPRSVLWLDDRIGEFEDVARETFASAGAILSTSGSIQAAEELLDNRDSTDQAFTELLVDLDLKERKSGIDFLESERVVAYLSRHHSRVFIVSSQLKSRRYRREVERLVRATNCRTIPVDSTLFESREVFSNRLVGTVLERREEVRHTLDAGNVFDLNFDQFVALSALERSNATRLAIQAAGESLSELVHLGYRWILFCGPEPKVLARQRSISEAWPDSEIRRRSSELDRPCFQLVVADEPEECEIGGSTYPTVRLRFEVPEAEDWTTTLHFDTGAGASFLSFDELNLRSLVDIFSWTPLFKIDNQGRQVETGSNGAFETFDVELISQGVGDNAPVSLRAWVVDPWSTSIYVRWCKVEECEAFRSANDMICEFRLGLIGRTLLGDNQSITLALDHTGRTRLV